MMTERLKILLFGCNGQVGSELQATLLTLGDLVSLDIDSKDLCGDFANPEGIARTVRQIRPDVIVNAAAYTAVDKAESESEIAFQINADTPAVLAREAEQIGAWLIHYSTDYVFDGTGETPWKESDTPNPLNVYGASKLKGERNIADHCSRYVILRTSWVYAEKGGNFAKTMLKLAKELESLSVVNDQVGSPTGARLLADLTAKIIPVVMHDPSLAGLYHAVASGETSWYDYARFVIKSARARGLELKVKEEHIYPVASDQYPTPARRPANSRLDTDKFREAFGINLPDWKIGVAELVENIEIGN